MSSWTCPISVKYTVYYDLNTGKISSVRYDSFEINPGLAMSPCERGRLVSLNYENIKLTKVNDYTLSCSVNAQADLIYFAGAGGINSEQTTANVSGSVQFEPPRP